MENKKIFILEDDVNILYGLEAQFNSDDFEVYVSSGEEDLDELIGNIKNFKPSYIVADLILPRLDGFEVVQRIKDDDFLSNVPIFIFTDLSQKDSEARNLGIDSDHYFIKEDIDIYQFAEKVKETIRREERAERLSKSEDEEVYDI